MLSNEYCPNCGRRMNQDKMSGILWCGSGCGLKNDSMKETFEKLYGGLEGDLQNLQTMIEQWSDQVFGPKDIFRLGSIVNHLAEEITEYAEEKKGEELADIGILLLDLLAGIGIGDNLASILDPLFKVDSNLFGRMCEKHKINLKRVWDRPMEGGRIKHASTPSEEETENQGSEESHA